MPLKKTVKLFVASGSELKAERTETILILNKLNKTHPHLHLEAFEWETDLPSGSYNGKVIQAEINPHLEACDIVLVLFFSKAGKFTVEEYHLAIEKHKKVFLYFKKGFSPEDENSLEEYGKVIALKKNVKKDVLFKDYLTFEAFQQNLYEDLNLYLSQLYPIIAPPTPLPHDENVREILLKGSRTYHEALIGPNGRFRHLNISEILLTGTKQDWIETHVELTKSFFGGQGGDFLEKGIASPAPAGIKVPHEKENNPVFLVREALEELHRDQCRHAMVVGDGGMGKTVSLLHWWETLLSDERSGPIPIFIALNEINSRPENQRHDFILDMIRKDYAIPGVTIEQIIEVMKTPLQDGEDFIPSMVLLLDGYNEVTVEHQLVLEIKTIAEKYSGVQMVITGRSDIRKEWGLIHWAGLTLKPLEDSQIAEYLEKIGKTLPEGAELKDLIRNPMMLTLYTASCEIQEKHRHTPGCDFKPDVETPGELLWNFIQAQVALWRDKLRENEKQTVYYKFLLMFVLPGLGYEMEKAGLFGFTKDQLDQHIDALCRRFSNHDFFDTFTEYEDFIDVLSVEELKEFKQIKKRNTMIRGILIREMSMLVEEGGMYRFLHQNFRDFFAAVHVLNEVEMRVKKKEIPEVLKERVLDFFVRRFIGELEGEHRVKPHLVEGEGWKINIKKESRLHRALDLCRGQCNHPEKNLSKVFGSAEPFFRKKFCIGYAVWNIVEVWKQVRGELSEADLTCLDLSQVSLNGVRCSHYYYNGRYLAANFEGARVHETNVLPQGHTHWVTSAVYRSDGKRILSASHDQTIKEWDAQTGQCLRTLSGHRSIVSSAVYRSDGKCILSASWDDRIKEWDAQTGQCLKTYKEGDVLNLPGYESNEINSRLKWDGNKIIVPSRSGKRPKLEIINMPGLWIQGCSFEYLEHESLWTDEGLKIMKQYCSNISITEKTS
ncbi:MAG: NACHT domain-containing protein [Candidatus Omnitrophota bacterium]